MSNCSNHKKDLFGQTDMKVVAEAISNLHYESLVDLLGFIEGKLCIDAMNDTLDRRQKLAKALYRAAEGIHAARKGIENAWQISKPFMEGEDEGNAGLFKITFTDWGEMDDRINADQRWMAVNEKLRIVVTAQTKEQAFEEVMISLRVMSAYESNYQLPPKPSPTMPEAGGVKDWPKKWREVLQGNYPGGQKTGGLSEYEWQLEQIVDYIKEEPTLIGLGLLARVFPHPSDEGQPAQGGKPFMEGKDEK